MESGFPLADNLDLPSGFKLDEDTLPPGFELDEKKYGRTEGELKALAAGAARGLTFGLSDQALTRLGIASPQTLKGLQEENPIASIAGEVVGTVAPLAAGPGVLNLPGTAAKIGRGVEAATLATLPKATTLAGRMATRGASAGAGLAAESALYGLGQSISENALGDHDLISEKTLANIGLAAAMGGGFGAIVGAAGAPFLKDPSRGLEKLQAMRNMAKAAPEEAAVLSGAPAKEQLSLIEELEKLKDNADEIIKAGEVIGAPVTPGMTSASKFMQDAESALSKTPTLAGVEAQKKIQAGFDAVDRVFKESLDVTNHLDSYSGGALIKSQLQKSIDDIYAPIKADYKAREALGETVNLADKSRLKFYDKLIKSSQAIGSRGGPLEQKVSQIAERFLAQNTVRELDNLLVELRSEASTAFMARDTALGHAISGTVESIDEFLSKEMLRDAARKAKATVPEGLPGVSQYQAANVAQAKAEYKGLIQKHKELKKRYAEFVGTLEDLLSDQRLGRGKATHGRLNEILEGIPNEKVLDKMFDPKNADGLKRLQEKFPEVFKTIIDQKKSQLLQSSTKDGRVEVGKIMRELYNDKKMSSKVRETMFTPKELEKLNAAKTWVEAVPPSVNPSGTAKATAFMEFITNPFKGTLDNLSAYAAKKMIDRFAGSAQEAAKAKTLINAEREAMKTSQRIQKGIKSIFEGSKSALPAKVFSKIASEEDYKEKTQEISKIANNPIEFSDHISSVTEGVYGDAPNIAMSLQGSMIRGIQFLSSKIKPISTNPFDEYVKPSRMEIDNFKRYYNIVQDPLLAIDQVRDSTITPETVETLAVVYPRLYSEMQEEMVDQLATQKEPASIPFKTRQALSMFLGMPIDQALSQESTLANQSTFMVVNQQEANTQAKFSKSGASKMTIAKRTELYRGQMEA